MSLCGAPVPRIYGSVVLQRLCPCHGRCDLHFTFRSLGVCSQRLRKNNETLTPFCSVHQDVNCHLRPCRTVVQAVILRLPTAAARVPTQVRSRRISCGQTVNGAGRLSVLTFPLPIFIPLTDSSIIRSWFNGFASVQPNK
jgi:hypothetical protein